MMQSFRSVAPWLGALVFMLVVAPAFSQIPQDATFTGHLVDNLGDPLVGPVDLELRIFDAETVGTQLYSEQHLVTALDATGGFSVQLGLGTSPSGPFDAALFSDLNRWLEVVVGTDALTPRQIIASVPWALIAQQANKIVPDPNGALEDCGDGSVWDPQTGLVWEKKIDTLGGLHFFGDSYQWSSSGSAPDGGAFTDFLRKLNDPTWGEAVNSLEVTGCFAGHCDWRLPNIVELKTIVDCGFGSPCINPIFGPTVVSNYWSASTVAGSGLDAWYANFFNGTANSVTKTLEVLVRAVRTGSCN